MFVSDVIAEYDDIGAVNFEAVCQSGARLVHRPMPSWINNRGEWSDMVFCPAEAPAVCGIKSRYPLIESTWYCLKYGPIPATFSFIFVLFSLQVQIKFQFQQFN